MDHTVRDLLTSFGGYDLCITEFLRVSNHQLLPERTFIAQFPELLAGGRTPCGTPTRIQLLGSQPDTLAMNAQRAIELGSQGVDLNLGCPAKTVNKSKGGAVMLKEPKLIHECVTAMRTVVPKHQTLSVKIRLGWDDPSVVHENVAAIIDAGADELTIHARTKEDGYKTEAIKWHKIAEVKQQLAQQGKQFTIIANGEIWSVEDAQACREVSQCDDIMIGRGSLAMPNLAAIVGEGKAPLTWAEIVEMLIRYHEVKIRGDRGHYYCNRVKQWLSQLRRCYPLAEELFQALRRIRKSDLMLLALQQYLDALIAGKSQSWLAQHQV